MKTLLLCLMLLLPIAAAADDYMVRYERTVLSDAPCETERNHFKATKNDAYGYIERGCWTELNGFIVVKYKEVTEQFPVNSFEHATEDDL